MQVQFKLTIGENEFTLVETVDNHSDFFKKLHFYSTLPKVGPNGETDLVLTYRVAQKQYEYYSIVSQKAQMEFKFGQSKDAKGTLFAKGWEPLFKGEGSEDGAEDGQQQSSGLGGVAPGASVGLGGPAAAPAPKAATGLATLGTLKAATPAPAPAAAAPKPAEAAPQVKAQAANILSKFGI